MYKRFVVRYYLGMEKPSKKKVARVFKLAPATVREWVKIKDELNNRKCPLSRRQMIKETDKPQRGLFPGTEVDLQKWFNDLRSNDIALTSND